jgi:hypothetical protein
MKRIRFFTKADDCRPVNWPIKHPYWITGEAGDGSYSVLVAYADDEQYIYDNWPEATDLDVMEETDSYTFTGRFPKPEWWTEE